MASAANGLDTWNGGGSPNFNWSGSSPANWTGANTPPIAGDTLAFDGSIGLSNTNNLAANTQFNGIFFNSGAGAFSLYGNSITLVGGITNNSANSQLINFPVINNASNTINCGSAAMTLGGAITGTGALTNVGSGTLSLTNGNGNSFSGGLTINAGTVQVGAGGSGNSSIGKGDVTINSGGTLVATNADGFGFTPASKNTPNNFYINGGTVTKAAGVTVSLDENITFSNGGTMTTSAGDANNWTILGFQNNNAQSLTISTLASSTMATISQGGTGLWNPNKHAVTFNIASGSTPGGVDLLFSAVWGGNQPLIKTNTGTLKMSAANTSSGVVTNSQGALLVSGSLASSSRVYLGPAVLCGAGTINGPVTNINSGAQINQETNYLITGAVGTLTLGNALDMSAGGICSLDLSTSAGSGNDKIAVTAGLTLNNNTFHIKALSGTANLDMTADYILVQAGSVSGSPNSIPSFDGIMPANGNAFRVQVSGNNVVLHYQPSALPLILSATATPSLVTNAQGTLLSVTVTNGTPLYTVTVDASPIGASSGVTLVLQGGGVTPGIGYVYTNTVMVATNVAKSYVLPVNVTDSGSQTASNNISLMVAVYLTWAGDGGGNSFWDVSSTEWQGGLIYSDGDAVRFDDSATGINATNVNLQTTLSPGGIVVSNTAGTSTGNYTFNGNNSISGSTALIKQGSGHLTMAEGADNFSGGIVVSGGSLLLSNVFGSVAISGGLTVTNGGSTLLDQLGTISGNTMVGAGSSVQVGAGDTFGGLPSGSVTMNGNLVFNRTDNISIGNIIGGASTGDLVQSNANNVTLTGANTFAGNITIASGTLTDNKVGDGSSGGLGSAQAPGRTITVASGATLSGTVINWFGSTATADANLPSIIINGGTSSSTRYTSIGNLTLNNGAALISSGSPESHPDQYQAFQFRGTITVGGSSASTISATTGKDNHLSTNTVFNVAVTSGAGPDLTVSTGLRDLSQDFSRGAGSLTKTGTGTMLLTASNSYSGNTTINAGTLALSGAGSISNSPNIILSSGSTFDISALSPGFVLMPGQTLSNNTSTVILNGSADATAGKISLTYASGTPSFTVTNGTLTLAPGTIFKVNNTGAALTAGSYKIISRAASGSAGAVAGTAPSVTVSGSGIVSGGIASLQISGGELDLIVASGTPPTPHITGISLNGMTLTMTATNGPNNGTYVLLESTNVALPLANWVPVLTNTFDSSGNLNLSTNVVNPSNRQQFYILSQ